MSARPAAKNSDRTPSGPSVDQALALMVKALEIIDSLGLSPDVGARLLAVISAVEESRARHGIEDGEATMPPPV